MKLKPVVASLLMLGLLSPAFAHSGIATQQAVVDQNSVIAPVCTEKWFDRITIGGIGSAIAIFGNHDAPGTFTALGNASDLYVNNLNLLVNACLSKWSKAAINLAYLGAPILWNRLGEGTTTPPEPSSRTIDHSIVADEFYVTLGNFERNPFYLIAGKKYLPFGDYVDPYIPLQIMSPAQMLAQFNAATVIAGVSTDFGFYGSLFGFRGETWPVGSTAGNIRNFGAKIGWHDDLEHYNIPDAHVNFALSYINNLWDSQFFTPNAVTKWLWDDSGVDPKLNHPGETFFIDRVGGVSAHGDFNYRSFSMFADFVTAIKSMVPDSYSTRNSRLWGANINAAYAFKTFNHDSHLGAGFQLSGNGGWFGDNSNGITDFTRIFPKWRLVGEYKVNLCKYTDLNLVIAQSKSYNFEKVALGGNTADRSSTVGLARLMVQF